MEFALTFIKLFLWAIYLIAPLLVVLSLVIIVLGQIVCCIEKWSKYDALYWSLITATTVGYGDIRPLHKISKALSVFIALIGMIFTGIVIAIAVHTTTLSLEKYADKEVMEKMKTEFHSNRNYEIK